MFFINKNMFNSMRGKSAMLYDGLTILEGGSIRNLVVDSGETLPNNPNIGELFFRTSDQTLQVYKSTGWTIAGEESTGGISTQIYDLALTIESKPNTNEIVFFFVSPRNFGFPINFTNSVAKSAVASTGTAVFTINKNGTQVGTITFESSSVGVFSAVAEVSLIAGDILSIIAPATQDTTLENIGITLVGNLSNTSIE
jgi:hypothetical protein